MALAGNAHAALAGDGRSLTLSHDGASSLRYSGLSATDASGRTLHSWLALQGGNVLIRVDARGARYPLRIDPYVQQGAKLTSSGGGGATGSSVALSGDGSTALVGAYADKTFAGAAFVFTRSGSTWTQQAKLTGSGEIGEGEIGDRVALSADGNTALIAGGRDNGGIGAVWVFTRSGTTWTQQGAKLTGSGEVGDGQFGFEISLSSAGNTALISAFKSSQPHTLIRTQEDAQRRSRSASSSRRTRSVPSPDAKTPAPFPGTGAVRPSYKWWTRTGLVEHPSGTPILPTSCRRPATRSFAALSG